MAIDTQPEVLLEDPVEATQIQPVVKAKSTPQPSYYRTIWRWHFFAGVITTPIVLMVAITGGIYIYSPEITDLMCSKTVFVKPEGQALSYDQQVTAAQAYINDDGFKLTRIFRTLNPTRASMITFTGPPPPAPKPEAGATTAPAAPRRGRGPRGVQKTLYVNQFTGAVQGTSEELKPYNDFFHVVLDLHRRLMMGTTGRYIVELTTSWLVILLVTGVYLWWPDKMNKVSGNWWPRFSGKKYIVLRDLHTISGIYLFPVLFIITVTGLFYSIVWSPTFTYTANQAIAVAQGQPLAYPKFAPARGGGGGGGERGPGGRGGDREKKKVEVPPPKFTPDEAMAKAFAMYPERDITLTMPTPQSAHYDMGAGNDGMRATFGAMTFTHFHLDRDTGEVEETTHLGNNPSFWWHTWTLPLHVGSILGQFSKAIWMLAILIIVAMPITGLWMWWERRPKGKTGLPNRPKVPLGPGIWAIIIVSSILMPVAGASIVAVFLLDQIVMWLFYRKKAQPTPQAS